MRFILATALGASAPLCSFPALAREPSFQIDVNAVEAGRALASLAAQTGTSFAYDAPLPRTPVRAVRGRMTVSDALDRMLEPLGLRAMRVGPRAYRVSPWEKKARNPPAAEPVPALDWAGDIVVTARKRAELVSNVAAAVATYQPSVDGTRSGAAATTRDVASDIAGLTFANGGPGRERLFIRGVADSPFTGFSQATVSAHVDNLRVTFDGTEPGLRLVDIERVEVLKGPQGPLYGTGALGGVYRIVTNRPLLGRAEANASIGASSRLDAMPGLQVEAMINLPIIEDHIALRAVGYTVTEGGWINDMDGRRQVNRATTSGFRLAARIVPFEGWTVDASAIEQMTNVRDSQYVNRPGGTLVRDVPIAEPRDDGVRIFQAAISGSIGSLPLTFTTGSARRRQAQIDDASAIASVLGFTPPVRFVDSRGYEIFDHELRLSSRPGSRLSWVLGASFLLARTDRMAIWYGAPLELEYVSANRRVTEVAIFADGSLPLGERLRLGIGARVFRAAVRDDRFAFDKLEARPKPLFGLTPNVSLSYEAQPDKIVYARFATAFRPGGLDPTNTATYRFEPDQVRTLDIGGRLRLNGGQLSIEGSLFATRWSNVQADYLESTGLIATHNVGRATIFGAEAEAKWRVANDWRINAGAVLQRPRLIEGMDGEAFRQPTRLPVVPDISAKLSVGRDIRLRRWVVAPTLSANFIGGARLGLDTEVDRSIPAHAIVRLDAVATQGKLAVRLNIDNLLDTHADTFGFGNAFSFRATRQSMPVRPRTVSISAARSF